MKKPHTRKLMQFVIVLCTITLFGCQEFEIDSQPVAGSNIQIDAMDSYTAQATAPSNIVFNISSNTPWTISSDQQWCKPSPAMSASSSLVSEVVVSLEPNTGKTARTATLTVKAEGVSETRTITIVQVSKEDLLVVPYDVPVKTEGEEITFTIVSNKPWEIIPSTLFVSNIDKKSGAGNEDGTEEVITVQIPANPGAKREGSLTIKTSFQEYSFVLTQNGIIIEQEEDPESTTITMVGHQLYSEKVVKIRANKEWKVEVPSEFQEWLEAEDIGNNELRIKTSVNNKLSNRTGAVILTTKDLIDGYDGVTFDVVQSSAFRRNGAASNFVDNSENGDLQIFGGGVGSNYLFKKGKLTYDFESINVTGSSWVEFNMWTDYGTKPNFHLHFKPGVVSNFTSGGGLNWTQRTFTWSAEQVNAVKKIEFVVENKPGDADRLVLRMIVDGVEVQTLDNNIMDVYKTGDDVNYPGQTVWLNLQSPNGTSNFVIKSITWEPID